MKANQTVIMSKYLSVNPIQERLLQLEIKKTEDIDCDDGDHEQGNDFSETCRICLNAGNIPIFGSPNISEDIIKFGCIHVSEIDGYPQHICNQCHEMLTSAVNFRTSAIESDLILRKDKIKELKEETSSGDELSDANSVKQEVSEEFSNISTYRKKNKELEEETSSGDELSDVNSEEFSDISTYRKKIKELKEETGSGDELSDMCKNSESSDVSHVYLEYDNSGNEENLEDNTEDAPSREDDEQIDAKDMYMVIVSDNKTTENVKFHCEVCNLNFNNADEVNEHFQTHEPETCNLCEICNIVMDKNLHEIHMKLHKEAFKQRIAKRKKQCKICGKFVHKTYLKFHMKMHGTNRDKNERMKLCTICDKRFSYYYFNEHMKRIHGKSQKFADTSQEKTIKCPICDRSFKEKNYKSHVASHGIGHHKQKQFICDQCGKVLKHSSALQTHSLIHGADLKFKCQFCPYRGLHLGLLKVHVRTHTKDYLYQCSTCNKKFLTKSNLSRHERKHKGSDFVCPECNKGLYSQRNLDKHYNLIHLGIRNEICEFCNKAFGHRDGLISHQNKLHNRKRNINKGRLPSYLKQKKNYN